METIKIIVLGIIQGIAEFLPISSKGHLLLTSAIFQQAYGLTLNEESNLLLVVILHVGTVFAVVQVYWRDLWELRRRPQLLGAMVIATIPAALVGLLCKEWFEAIYQQTILVGFGLLVTATFLTLGQRLERDETGLPDIKWHQALVVGLFQVCALFPGISRSGSTITGGLLAGLKREAATTFSFLISVPIICGAIILPLAKAYANPDKHVLLTDQMGLWLVGALIAYVVGLLSLRVLVRMIARGQLYWFVYYCVAVAIATIAWQLSV